jgi:hypothetical protein
MVRRSDYHGIEGVVVQKGAVIPVNRNSRVFKLKANPVQVMVANIRHARQSDAGAALDALSERSPADAHPDYSNADFVG